MRTVSKSGCISPIKPEELGVLNGEVISLRSYDTMRIMSVFEPSFVKIVIGSSNDESVVYLDSVSLNLVSVLKLYSCQLVVGNFEINESDISNSQSNGSIPVVSPSSEVFEFNRLDRIPPERVS